MLVLCCKPLSQAPVLQICQELAWAACCPEDDNPRGSLFTTNPLSSSWDAGIVAVRACIASLLHPLGSTPWGSLESCRVWHTEQSVVTGSCCINGDLFLITGWPESHSWKKCHCFAVEQMSPIKLAPLITLKLSISLEPVTIKLTYLYIREMYQTRQTDPLEIMLCEFICSPPWGAYEEWWPNVTQLVRPQLKVWEAFLMIDCFPGVFFHQNLLLSISKT